jgi:hypothetical protein
MGKLTREMAWEKLANSLEGKSAKSMGKLTREMAWEK